MARFDIRRSSQQFHRLKYFYDVSVRLRLQVFDLLMSTVYSQLLNIFSNVILAPWCIWLAHDPFKVERWDRNP